MLAQTAPFVKIVQKVTSVQRDPAIFVPMERGQCWDKTLLASHARQQPLEHLESACNAPMVRSRILSGPHVSAFVIQTEGLKESRVEPHFRIFGCSLYKLFRIKFEPRSCPIGTAGTGGICNVCTYPLMQDILLVWSQ